MGGGWADIVTTGSLPGFDRGRADAVDRVLDRFVEQETIVGGVLGITNRVGD